MASDVNPSAIAGTAASNVGWPGAIESNINWARTRWLDVISAHP
jgi:hypothetical protein